MLSQKFLCSGSQCLYLCKFSARLLSFFLAGMHHAPDTYAETGILHSKHLYQKNIQIHLFRMITHSYRSVRRISLEAAGDQCCQ